MNNDLVSRKWLTDAICNRKTYLSYEDAKDVIDLINNAPNVKAFTEEDMAGAYNEGYACGDRENEIPQGEWIFDKENSFTIDMFKCSICGYFGHTHFRFCPDCGAKMKGGAV